MNEKKSNGFAALILSLVVVVVAVFGVKFAGGTAASVVPGPGPEVTPGETDGPAAKYVAGTYTASAQGLNSAVTVTVTVDAEKIVSIEVDASGETTGLGDVAADKVAARIMEAQSTEVDVIAGASMSSNAVIAAVSDCLTQAAPTGGAGEAAGIYKEGTYTASAQGLNSAVTVTVTVDAEKIVSIEVDASGETTGLGDVAADKVAARIMEAQSTEVDVIAGASMSSNAVITAVADCLAQAAN